MPAAQTINSIHCRYQRITIHHTHQCGCKCHKPPHSLFKFAILIFCLHLFQRLYVVKNEGFDEKRNYIFKNYLSFSLKIISLSYASPSLLFAISSMYWSLCIYCCMLSISSARSDSSVYCFSSSAFVRHM